MKILVISQYFWPENFKINDLCLGLKEQGHEISVLTAKPNYPKGEFFEGYSFSKRKDENWNGIKIYRSNIIPRGNGGRRLFFNYFSFVLFGSLKSFFIKEKIDKILVYEPSPITVGLPAIVAARRMNIPFYFWVQDLWPESLSAAGGIKNKFILKSFDKITRLVYREAHKVLVQSKGFIDYISAQGVEKEKIVYYPNTTESFYRPMEAQEEYLEKLPKGFNLMFAGNLGEAQGINYLLEAAEIVERKGFSVNWIFLGDGRQKSKIESEIAEKGLKNIFLLGAFPGETMPFFFSCADALIVSLKRNRIFSLTIPSKLQSYLACGKPILAALDGEGAKVVNESNSGYCSPTEDPETFAENVIKMARLSKEERKSLGENALKYYRREFEREALLHRLEEILHT